MHSVTCTNPHRRRQKCLNTHMQLQTESHTHIRDQNAECSVCSLRLQFVVTPLLWAVYSVCKPWLTWQREGSISLACVKANTVTVYSGMYTYRKGEPTHVQLNYTSPTMSTNTSTGVGNEGQLQVSHKGDFFFPRFPYSYIRKRSSSTLSMSPCYISCPPILMMPPVLVAFLYYG